MSAIKSENLPVAPEFIESLRETATANLKHCLEALKVPADVLALVDDIENLSCYQRLSLEGAQNVGGDDAWLDGKSVVIDTINNLARVGGTFPGYYFHSLPRPGTLLAKAKEENSEKVKAG